MNQSSLPGTDTPMATYSCREREHRIPSDHVRVMKSGVGFMAGCACGPEPLAEINQRPHQVGYGHVVLLGGVSLSPALWLALDELADGWYDDPDTEPVGDGPTAREARREYRADMEAKADDETSK